MAKRKKPVKAKRKPSIKERQAKVLKKKAAEKLVTVLGRRKASEISYEKAKDPKHRIKTAAFPEKEKRRIGEKGVKARKAEIKEKSKKRTEAKKAQAIKEYKESKVGKKGGAQRTYLQPQDTRRSVVPAGERKTLKEPPKALPDKYRGGPPATTGERGLTVPDKGKIPKDKSLVKYKSNMPATTGGGAKIPPSVGSRLLRAAGRAAGPASTLLMGVELADLLWEKQKEGSEYKLFNEPEGEIPRPFQKGGMLSPGAYDIYPRLEEEFDLDAIAIESAKKVAPGIEERRRAAEAEDDVIDMNIEPELFSSVGDATRRNMLIAEDQQKQERRVGPDGYRYDRPFDEDDRAISDFDPNETYSLPNASDYLTEEDFLGDIDLEVPLSLDAEAYLMKMEEMPEKKETEDYTLEAALIAGIPMAIGAAFQGEAGLAIGAEAGGEAALGLLDYQMEEEKREDDLYEEKLQKAMARNFAREKHKRDLDFKIMQEMSDRRQQRKENRLKFAEFLTELKRKNYKTANEFKLAAIKAGISQEKLQDQIRHTREKDKINLIKANKDRIKAERDLKREEKNLLKEQRKAEKETKLTESQIRAGQHGVAALEAHRQLKELEEKGFTGTSYGQAFDLWLPPIAWFKSEEARLMNQAQMNFLNNALRHESGAAVPETEYPKYRVMFFPRVRDTKAAIRQAQLTRERWVEIRRGVSGAAFEKAYQALINKGIDGAEEVMIKNPKTDLEIQYEQLLMMKR